MPSITLTLTAAQATRVAAALAATPYPTTTAGYKALLVDYTRNFVAEYERAVAVAAATAAVTPPADLTAT